MGIKRHPLVVDMERKRFALLFPGQGAQHVGMGKDLCETYSEAKRTFEEADKIAQFPISKICFEGPDDVLTDTANAQLGIFVTSIAALRILQTLEPALTVSAVCGLSLGEFTALVACHALSFEDGLRLVKRRAELMKEAGKRNPGTMASILGLSESDCETIAQQAGVELANINSQEQIVLSGTRQGIQKACELAKQAGAKKAIPLKVSGAFHSKLMEYAESELTLCLKDIRFKKPSIPFIPNITGNARQPSDNIPNLLSSQLTNRVQWLKTMQTLKTLGITEAMEVGPGQILKGLAKRIDTALNVTPLGTAADFGRFIKVHENQNVSS